MVTSSEFRDQDVSRIDVLFEAHGCLVVCKPAGLATQAPAPFDSLERRLKAWLTDRAAIGQNPAVDVAEIPYLGVPHRQDRCASGAMVFATDPRAARKISRQFEDRKVKKTYWACVQGVVEPRHGTWRDYLLKVHGHPRAEVCQPADPDAKLAILHYQTVGESAWGSCLEIELETGRTHQIRVQAASRGHPVLGDAFYGASVPFGVPHEDERLRAIALHGRRLVFCDPTTREVVDVVAPLSNDWGDVRGVFASGPSQGAWIGTTQLDRPTIIKDQNP